MADGPSGRDSAPPAPGKQPWWKRPIGRVGAVLVLAAIAVGGYFGVDALLSHPSPNTSLSTAAGPDQVPGLPPGAAACKRVQTDVQKPFNSGARGTPATSCGFVEQVRKEYAIHSTPSSGPSELDVVSPATFRWYRVACFNSGDYVTCTGGAAAVVYLYNKPGA